MATAAPKPTPNQPDTRRIALTDPSQLATGAGIVTLAVGSALAVKPESTSRALGLGLGTRGGRALAATDLAIGPMLVAGRNRAPWMAVRTAMNLGIVLQYRRALRDGGGARARGGLILMSVLTVLDGAVAFSLSRTERKLG